MEHTDWTTTGALGDRYVLRSRVGSGRTTTVYAADDVRLEREVAVKLLHTAPDQDAPDQDGLTRLANEAQVLGGLSHPGLVTVYDVNLGAQTPYMVMRLIDGGPLSEFVQPQGIEPRAVARLGAQLAEVLAYVHERGVVHGDVDAHNVLIDADADGHLTGFGADYGLGTMPGDVYSLGMMLAECLPFGLGGEWRVVLSSMTDPDPDARPTAYRAAEMLRNIVAGDTAEFPLPLPRGEQDAVEPPLPAKERKERKEPARHIRPAFAGLTGMGLAVSALAVVLATTNPSQPAQPSGEQPPKVEQPADRNLPQPPGQSYPQAPGQLQAPPPKSSTSHQDPPEPTRPPPSSTTRPSPPPDGDDQDDDRPGNGRGRGNGNGGGLLGGLLGL